MSVRVDVLLATYNGEAFLAEQLDSLLAQRSVVSTVLARDDGSSDTTRQILQDYAGRFPGRFVVFDDSPGRLGVIGSFGWLLGRSTAPYVAFCDQDDVWDADKLHILLARMQVLEARLGTDRPILVHSDLEVVDQQLERMHLSFWAQAGGDARRHRLAQLLISNTVTGCAMLANRALVERASPIPPDAVMHDHWFALVAAAFGHIEPVDRPLVAYRQHVHNALGAYGSGWRPMLRRIRADGGRKDISALQLQAARFFDRFERDLTTDQRELVRGFSTLHHRNWIARRLFLLRHGVLRSGVARNLVLLFYVRMAEGAH